MTNVKHLSGHYRLSPESNQFCVNHTLPGGRFKRIYFLSERNWLLSLGFFSGFMRNNDSLQSIIPPVFQLFLFFFSARNSLFVCVHYSRVSMGLKQPNGLKINRQPSNNRKFNRQPSKAIFFNRQGNPPLRPSYSTKIKSNNSTKAFF